MKDRILLLLKERRPLSVYQIAKELGATYGIAQYYIEQLIKNGTIYTVKAGARQYVALNGQDWLKAVTVQDVVLKRAKINPKMPLYEALKMLEHKAPHAAEALMLIVKAFHRQVSTQSQFPD